MMSKDAFDLAINMEQMQFRFCATGTVVTDGSTILGAATDCNQSAIDYLLSLPEREKSWFEIRGGALGPDWMKVADVGQEFIFWSRYRRFLSFPYR